MHHLFDTTDTRNILTVPRSLVSTYYVHGYVLISPRWVSIVLFRHMELGQTETDHGSVEASHRGLPLFCDKTVRKQFVKNSDNLEFES